MDHVLSEKKPLSCLLNYILLIFIGSIFFSSQAANFTAFGPNLKQKTELVKTWGGASALGNVENLSSSWKQIKYSGSII